jgi:hypothetical protein
MTLVKIHKIFRDSGRKADREIPTIFLLLFVTELLSVLPAR